MADIELHRVHGMGLKAARAAAERMAGELGRKFDLKGDWQGDVLHFERPGVSGSLTVTERDLKLSVALGFLLKAMKGSIESAVVRQLDALFPPAAAATPAAKAKKAPPRPKKGG
jgi:putative polyhydroxyalkanoate system protein